MKTSSVTAGPYTAGKSACTTRKRIGYSGENLRHLETSTITIFISMKMCVRICLYACMYVGTHIYPKVDCQLFLKHVGQDSITVFQGRHQTLQISPFFFLLSFPFFFSFATIHSTVFVCLFVFYKGCCSLASLCELIMIRTDWRFGLMLVHLK